MLHFYLNKLKRAPALSKLLLFGVLCHGIDLLLDFIWFIYFFFDSFCLEKENQKHEETAFIKCKSKFGTDEANQIIINGILFANDLFLDKLNIDNEEKMSKPPSFD